MTRAHFVLFTVAATMTAACGDAAPDADSHVRVEIDTVGATVVVNNTGTPPAWQLEPVLRLGTLEGGPEQFGQIRSLLADSEGAIYVADNHANVVRVFAADGRHLRDIGRQGQGPGEFGDLYSLAWLGDALAAMDPANSRIGVFSRQGAWLEAIPHFPITGPASQIRLHPLHAAGFYAPVIDPRLPGLPWARLTPTGPRDTILAPAPPPGAPSSTIQCPLPSGGFWFITPPEAPQLVFAFPPAGGVVAVNWTDEYRVRLLSARGDTVRVLTRHGARSPYPDSLWDRAMQPYREYQDTPGAGRCEPGPLQRPQYRASMRHLLFDDAGRLWVEAASEAGYVWEVFDAEGRLLGAAPAPPRVAHIPPYTRNGHLYQVEADALGVHHVGVYRLSGDG